ncbi:probable polygalacturonase At3g15720 [Impatiens glandulifera]|uniref:probable polygalacturonase At3g15720 n=1 Tax=Impatiens glandulifera TaxID=253017 RepID=UPI001FB068C5|nr:probable polygalacturonase At3g15720 [Impatiens glandulifera]
MVVPAGKSFLTQALVFNGPCSSSSITFQLLGTIIAPSKSNFKNPSEKWLLFSKVNGLVINGNGSFDGSATMNDWWKGSSIATGPIVLYLSSCSNLRLNGPSFFRPPKAHININGCNNVTISNIQINAPENSPNTDGIDISDSSDINFSDSKVQTGDDCVAINGGSAKINITRINCGPGHGISVGSLGRFEGRIENVENVHVKNCTFTKTTNAARIKTANGESGSAKMISYEDIILIDTENPILIDQNYCPRQNCSNNMSKVKISDVTFTGFKGTTTSNVAVKLDCSSGVPCMNIKLDNIKISGSASLKDPVTSVSNNAFGSSSPTNIPKVTMSS